MESLLDGIWVNSSVALWSPSSIDALGVEMVVETPGWPQQGDVVTEERLGCSELPSGQVCILKRNLRASAAAKRRNCCDAVSEENLCCLLVFRCEVGGLVERGFWRTGSSVFFPSRPAESGTGIPTLISTIGGC